MLRVRQRSITYGGTKRPPR